MPETIEKRTLSGRDIRAERARHKVTQPQLAEKVGAYLHVIVGIEREQVELSQEEYHRILDAIKELAEVN